MSGTSGQPAHEFGCRPGSQPGGAHPGRRVAAGSTRGHVPRGVLSGQFAARRHDRRESSRRARPAPLGYALASADVHAFRRHVQPRIVRQWRKHWSTRSAVRLVPNIVRGLRDAEPAALYPGRAPAAVRGASRFAAGAGRALLNWLEPAFKERGIARYRVAVRSRLGKPKPSTRPSALSSSRSYPCWASR